MRDLPLQQLITLSQGQLPQAVVDDLVLRANDGVMPTDDEEPVRGRSGSHQAGSRVQTVIVTGAASESAERPRLASHARAAG